MFHPLLKLPCNDRAARRTRLTVSVYFALKIDSNDIARANNTTPGKTPKNHANFFMLLRPVFIAPAKALSNENRT